MYQGIGGFSKCRIFLFFLFYPIHVVALIYVFSNKNYNIFGGYWWGRCSLSDYPSK